VKVRRRFHKETVDKKCATKGVINMELKTGDIVRFKPDHETYRRNRELYKGLFEVVDSFTGRTYHYSVTNDEADTELYINKDEIMLVCRTNQRKDI
jgi:hypothetical protein